MMTKYTFKQCNNWPLATEPLLLNFKKITEIIIHKNMMNIGKSIRSG